MTSAERSGLSPRARLLLPIFLVALVGLSVYRLVPRDTPPQPPSDPKGAAPDLVVLQGQTMGTSYTIKLLSPPLQGGPRDDVERLVRDTLEEVDASMSSYRQDSEVNRLNRHRSPEMFRLGRALRTVLKTAETVSEQSGGALDVTVAPLVGAWGFGPKGAYREPPTDKELSAIRGAVGYGKLKLGQHTATKAHMDLSVDVSSVAKGYAVDRLTEGLRGLGFENLLVEVGGELKAQGQRSEGHDWRVAVEKPDSRARTVQEVLRLKDRAMATSGDYRNFYEKDGKRYAHLIDPRSGRPVEHSLASVTVLSERAAVADAWATALSVLGPTEGPALANEKSLAALFIVREPGGGFRSIRSSAFQELAIDRDVGK